MIVRTSNLPIIDNCIGSAYRLDEDLIINSSGEPAKIGSAVHDVMACIIKQDCRENWWVKAACDKYSIRNKTDEVGWLSWNGLLFWKESNMLSDDAMPLRDYFEAPLYIEKELVYEIFNIKLIGHGDVLSSLDDGGIGVDWKTGHLVDSDYTAQYKGYGVQLANLLKLSLDSTVTMYQVQLRENSVLGWEFNVRELYDWIHDLLKAVSEWDHKSFSPGDHCKYCQNFNSCPARSQLVRSAIRDFDIMGIGEDAYTPEIIRDHGISLYERAGMVIKVCDMIRNLVKDDIAVNGKIYEGGKVAQFGDPKIVFISDMALAVIREYVSDEKLIQQVKITNKMVNTLIGDAAKDMGFKTKKKARSFVFDTIREIGGIVPGSRSIQIKKIEKELP